jgi:small basic protein
MWVSVQTRAGIALGIVFCMTVKPDAIGALLAIVVAAALGFAASLPALGRGREPMTTQETTA